MGADNRSGVLSVSRAAASGIDRCIEVTAGIPWDQHCGSDIADESDKHAASVTTAMLSRGALKCGLIDNEFHIGRVNATSTSEASQRGQDR